MFSNSNDKTIMRFISAHKGEYKRAHQEINGGEKTSHWIWYIFPQLKALGYSDTAKYYGIRDFNEACNYLKEPLLFNHYYEMVTLVELQIKKGIVIKELMGGDVDAKKLASSLTLFFFTARHLAALEQESTPKFTNLANCCDRIFKIIEEQGYHRCQSTQKILNEEIKNNNKSILIKPDSAVSPSDNTLKKEDRVKEQQSKETKSTILDDKQPHKQEFFSKDKILPDNFKKNQIPVPSNDKLLNKQLNQYLLKRKNEWEFHSNFLGIIAFIYYLQDAITGSDHYSHKNRTTKLSAATKLKRIIESTSNTTVSFTPHEAKALTEGRLGKIVTSHGGLGKIVKQSPEESNQSNSGNSIKKN